MKRAETPGRAMIRQRTAEEVGRAVRIASLQGCRLGAMRPCPEGPVGEAELAGRLEVTQGASPSSSILRMQAQ